VLFILQNDALWCKTAQRLKEETANKIKAFAKFRMSVQHGAGTSIRLKRPLLYH
jgi:hypothetical protein